MSVKYFDKEKEKWVIFPGTVGAAGKSAYELAVQQGYKGTINEWIESLNGTDGKDAYTIAVEKGYTGTEEEYNEILSIIPVIAEKLKNIDEVPTDDSKNLVLSGGVKRAIDDINANISNNIDDKIKSFIVDNLTTSDPNKALSANQGKILKDLIDNLSILEFVVVDELPPTGNNNIIYLLRKSNSDTDIYDEYMYINDNWEKIGNTNVDLSNYYTSSQVDAIKEELDGKIGNNTENINNLTETVNNLTTDSLTTANSLEIQKNGTKLLEWNGSVKGIANIEVPNSLSDLNPKQQDIIDALGYRPADSSSAGSGDVTGPTNSVDSNFASFSGNNGKVIKDSGYNVDSFATKVHTHSTSDITGLGNLATKDKVGESDLNFTIPIGIEVDDNINDTSVNPVQNKVISVALNNKVDTVTLKNYYTRDDIDDKLVDAGLGDVVAADQFSEANRIIISNGVGKVIKDSNILIDNIATKTYVDNKGVSWDNISNKPDSYAPSYHTHTLSEVTDAGALASKDKINVSDLNFSLPSGITVDSELNQQSDNPVSNSTIANKFTEIEQQITNLPSGGDVTASGNEISSGEVVIGCGNKVINSSGVNLSLLATQEWTENLIFSQGFVNENTWRPIKVGDTILDDKTTSLTIANGTGINLEFSNGTLTISAGTSDSSYTLPIASDSALGGIKTGYTSLNNTDIAVNVSNDGKAYINLVNDNITAALGYTPANINNIPSYLPNEYSLNIQANNITTVYTGEDQVNINLDAIFSKKLPVLTNPDDAGKPGILESNISQLHINPRVTKENSDAIVVVPGSTVVTCANSSGTQNIYMLKEAISLLDSIEGAYKCFCISWLGENDQGEDFILINGAVYDVF